MEKNGKKGTRVFRKGTVLLSVSSCHLEKMDFMLGISMRPEPEAEHGGGQSVGEGTIAVVG